MDLATGGIVLFAILVAAGIIPLVMAARVKVRSLRILSLLLGLFAVVHGFYISPRAFSKISLPTRSSSLPHSYS